MDLLKLKTMITDLDCELDDLKDISRDVDEYIYHIRNEVENLEYKLSELNGRLGYVEDIQYSLEQFLKEAKEEQDASTNDLLQEV